VKFSALVEILSVDIFVSMLTYRLRGGVCRREFSDILYIEYFTGIPVFVEMMFMK
jgi:hypothetical protein